MRIIPLLATGLLATTSIGAHAAYVTVTYQGTINTVYDGSSFYLGEPIVDTVTFDPDKLVDVTASGNAVVTGPAIGGAVSFASILSASLADDPYASATIRIGDDVFSKFDQANYGTPTSDTPFNLGVGNFPNVFYLNGSFAGIAGVFVDAAGTYLATDPIAAAEGFFDGHSFYIGDDSSDAEGDYDLGDAVFSPAAVPEPAGWATMIAGIGATGAALRRGRRRTRTAVA